MVTRKKISKRKLLFFRLNNFSLFSSCKPPNYGKKKLGKPFPKFTLSEGKEEILRKLAWACRFFLGI